MIYLVYIYMGNYKCLCNCKLTLSACVWRWSCTQYMGADNVAGGSGEA